MGGFITFLVSIVLIAIAPLLFLYGDSLGIFAFLYSASVFPVMLLIAGWKLAWKRAGLPKWTLLRALINIALCGILLLLTFFGYLWYVVSNSF